MAILPQSLGEIPSEKTSCGSTGPGSPQATAIPNTEGANFPFWSPDGKSLGFFADGKLKKLDLSGGPPQTLCEAPTGRGGAWNKDGVILFTPSGQLGVGLYRIAASGGTPTQVTFPDRARGEDSHRWPVFLPDGIHFLYLAMDLSVTPRTALTLHLREHVADSGDQFRRRVIHKDV